MAGQLSLLASLLDKLEQVLVAEFKNDVELVHLGILIVLVI